jgi:heavy metal sensor kinase
MKPLPVRVRLTAWYAAILACTFAAAGAGVWWTIRESIYRTVDQDLRSRLLALRRYLETEVNENGGPLLEELVEPAAFLPAGTDYRIADPHGRWLVQSPASRKWAPLAAGASSLPAFGKIETIEAGGESIRMLSAPVPIGTAQLGLPLDAFEKMLRRFTWTALLASPLLLLLASAGGYWMSRRALEPVDRIIRTAGQIEARNLSERLPLRGSGDELDRLSETLNSMFTRLEEAFRRITQFTADASHELRTPVAIIRTTAELARAKPRREAEYAQALDRILAESERTTRMLEDLMLLARADSHSMDFVREPLDLSEVVRDACADADVLAQAAGIRLEKEHFPECPIVGDEHALRRLLLILLDNAVKYTPPGGHVAVSLDRLDRGSEVRIRDTGIGIPAEHLPHIFERFYRVSKDRSRATGGTGLGLSIARWIAEQHGGGIRVESTPGVGSEFCVRLPLG